MRLIYEAGAVSPGASEVVAACYVLALVSFLLVLHAEPYDRRAHLETVACTNRTT